MESKVNFMVSQVRYTLALLGNSLFCLYINTFLICVSKYLTSNNLG